MRLISVDPEAATLGWRSFGDDFFDGWLYGRFDDISKKRGRDLVYVFPDFRTALRGDFAENGIMTAAKRAKVTAFRCRGGVLEIKTGKAKDGGEHDYFRENPGIKFITTTPTVMDPLEMSNVYISNSRYITSLVVHKACVKTKEKGHRQKSIPKLNHTVVDHK